MSYGALLSLMLFALVAAVSAAFPPPPPEDLSLLSLPAVVTFYDPAAGGINCDGDCSNLASGPWGPEHYGIYAACDVSMLGGVVTLPGVGSFRCMDTGGLIRPAWSSHFGRVVLYFDILWDLSEWGVPPWNYWLIEDWEFWRDPPLEDGTRAGAEG